MEAIKIFGLPRSGTNVAEFLFRKHFKLPVLVNTPCWKHGANTWDGEPFENTNGKIEKLHYVICVRDPIRWLWSLYQFEIESKRQHKTPIEFLSQPAWHYRENQLSPCDAFNILIKNWLESCPGHILVKQKESQHEPSKMIQRVANNFDLEIQGRVTPVEKRIHPGCVVKNDLFKNRNVNFDLESLTHINESLNKELVKKIGF